MIFKKTLMAAACLVLSFASFAADKLAIAEPVGKGGVTQTEIEIFWSILESSVHSKDYTLISRSALKQMMTEIGLMTSSNISNLNSEQKAKLGKLEGVKYILVSEIGKFGTQLNCTIRIMDSSTGEIDQARSANLRVKDLDELAERIEVALKRILDSKGDMENPGKDEDGKTASSRPPRQSAILPPVVESGAPSYLADEFNAQLESSLLEKGVKLKSSRSVASALQKGLKEPSQEINPKKLGEILDAEIIVQATITSFEIRKRTSGIVDKISAGISGNGASRFAYTCNLKGFVRFFSAETDVQLDSIPFEEYGDINDLPDAMSVDDCGKLLIKTIVRQKIVPVLVKKPVFKELVPAENREKPQKEEEKERK
jgi:hypothetical protein